MRKVRFFNKNHECAVKKERNLFAQATETDRRARDEFWLFCPWCGESLGEFVEIQSGSAGKIHIYETAGESEKSIPITGEYFTSNCGLTLKVDKIWYRESPEDLMGSGIEVCRECLLQRSYVPPPRYTYCLGGEIIANLQA